MKTLKCLLAILLLCAIPSLATDLKPRVVIMTDIGPADVEPDDNESAVRLLAYANRFEIEAICTTIGWNCDPYPEDWAVYLDRVIEAYSKDVHNLMKRSGQEVFKSLDEENGKQTLGYWPSAEYIKGRAMMGSRRAGIGVIGDGNDSPGSEQIIRLLNEDDDRPIWVLSWGGSNTLAQTLWRLQQTCTPEQLAAYLHKLRIYTITDQDMQYSMRMQRDYSSHQWMRSEFKDDLLFIWDESAWLNQNELGKQNWEQYASLIQGKGEMGKVYPTYKWGVEGDTPSFLHVMPNGLNDPDRPEQIGWGGYHAYALSPDSVTYAWTNWHAPAKGISDAYEKQFYPDEFRDFTARMQWADTGAGNVNPDLIINGIGGISPITIYALPGQTVSLDASASTDRDGDNIHFNWWTQPEVSEFSIPSLVDAPKTQFGIPEGTAGKSIQIICEAHDDGPFALPAYRRIIVKVLPQAMADEGKITADGLPEYAELTPCDSLRDPLLFIDGKRRVETYADWIDRRAEIATLIQKYEIGQKPSVPRERISPRMAGDTLIVDVTVGGETLTLRSVIEYPSVGQAPYPLMIGTSRICLPDTLFENRPIARMTYHESQVNDYTQWGRTPAGRGNYEFDRLYPDLADNGAYSEWAWGFSRLIDGLQMLGPDVTKIDTNRIGVTGCSYAGKMALFCGAFDERVALVIAQEPGGGGAAAWRVSETLGEVETLSRTDFNWFLESEKELFGSQPELLPFDHHELVGMVFPRAILILGNTDYQWLADPSTLASAQAAYTALWDRYGISDRAGYSINGGHPHCLLPEEQWPEVAAFIDRFLLNRPVITGVRFAPKF